MTELPLTVISETPTTITLGWTPPVGCRGYIFRANGKRSSTLDPTRSSVKFAKPGPYEVEPLGTLALGSYPPVTPPPPPPSGWTIAPPKGPLTLKDGGMTQSSAVFSRDPGSPDIGGLEVKNYTGYGVAQMAWNGGRVASTGTSHIHDILVSGKIGTNRSQNGTAEAGMWLGQRTLAERFVIKGGDWMGLWTGADCHDSIIQDFQILDVPFIGAYLEHVTKNTVLRRFNIKSASTGINIEWWYGGEGSSNLLIESGKIYCPAGGGTVAGIFADAGTYGCTFRNIEFWGPGNAIRLPNKLADPSKPNKVENCVFNNSGSHVTYHDNNIG